MKGIHQVEPKQEISLCHIQSSGSEKEQPVQEILLKRKENGSGVSAGNSQNVLFPEN